MADGAHAGDSGSRTVSLDYVFPFCSNAGMVKRAINAGTPSAASPATDEAAQDAAMLSRMAARAEDLASAFHAQGIAALKAGDLDRAGEAETRFNSLFLGIRRAVALKARLRQQHEETRHKAETHKDRRRHAVAQGLSQAIAVVSPEFHERFTADLWERLTENDRIDADLADTALPVEALIRRLGRQIGLADSAIAYGLDPALAKARATRATALEAWSPAVAPAGDDDDLDDTEEEPDTESAQYCHVPAADLGLPGDGACRVRVDTGEVFDDDDNVVMTLPVPAPLAGRRRRLRQAGQGRARREHSAPRSPAAGRARSGGSRVPEPGRLCQAAQRHHADHAARPESAFGEAAA
jgi:hypothetical protein